jgi:DNA polymerase-3 subunit epsilon
VRFENQSPAASFTTLLRPPPELGEFIHTDIHGITEADCANAPSLPEALPSITDFVGAVPVVCHNSGFDLSVLRRTLDHFAVDYPELTYGCTLAFSRRALRDDPGIVQFNLPRVCQHLGIPFDETHRAEADAEACGHVAAKLCERAECSTLSELADAHGVLLGALGPWLDQRCQGLGGIHRNPEGVAESMRRRLGVSTLDPGGELAGKVVVITGTLMSLTRADAESLLVACGATVGKSVTRKTNILIEGQQATFGMSSKQARCMELKAKGQHIEVLDERMFLEELGD